MKDPYVHISSSLIIPLSELEFKTSRSGGPGGQNVNKLETRVELFFDVSNSRSLSEQTRRQLLAHLHSQLDSSGILRIVAQDSRSQWKNKQLAIERFAALLKSALVIRKKRRATRPTKLSKLKPKTDNAKSKTEGKREIRGFLVFSWLFYSDP